MLNYALDHSIKVYNCLNTVSRCTNVGGYLHDKADRKIQGRLVQSINSALPANEQARHLKAANMASRFRNVDLVLGTGGHFSLRGISASSNASNAHLTPEMRNLAQAAALMAPAASAGRSFGMLGVILGTYAVATAAVASLIMLLPLAVVGPIIYGCKRLCRTPAEAALASTKSNLQHLAALGVAAHVMLAYAVPYAALQLLRTLSAGVKVSATAYAGRQRSAPQAERSAHPIPQPA